MPDLKKFYIDGMWVEPNGMKEFPVRNPATEEQIGAIRLGNQEDVNAAVAAAKRAFITYSKTSREERLALLKKILQKTEERLEDLAQAMTAEMGAPITMSRNAQATAGIEHIKAGIKALEKEQEQENLASGENDFLVREPIGVCGLITPWNWPINQVTLKVVPALATGCTCVLKPSEHTPVSAAIFTQVIHDAGVPAGVFNLIQGEGPVVGAALSCHPDIQMMSFTGSTRAGKSITKDSADTVKRVTLELGGKSPNIVFADSNLQQQITASVSACFFNSGQGCAAPTRLLVERSCYEEVLGIAKQAAESVQVGDPTVEGNHIGPLFDKIQYDRVQTLIQSGIDEGATLLAGGLGKPEGKETGWYVKPTIFSNVSNSMRIAREEIFGPVLVVIPFDDEAEAIEIANDTDYGLAAYIQTADSVRAKRVASQLQAGQVHVNGGPSGYEAPFGGYKQSGNGREAGAYGLKEYQEIKTVHFG